MLAKRFNAKLILEEFETNPFLEEFYKDMERYAMHTQLYFLINRYYQQRDMAQQDLFQKLIITDYIFAKNHIFAYLGAEYVRVADCGPAGLCRYQVVDYERLPAKRIGYNPIGVIRIFPVVNAECVFEIESEIKKRCLWHGSIPTG